MEASKWCPQHGYPLPCDKCGLGEYERGKADGIKEVVEWLDNQYDGSEDMWHAKLKEWGL